MRFGNVATLQTRAAFAAFALAFALATPAAAEGLAGSWSGNGSVVLPSGDSEKARCKVTFRKEGGKNYTMDAVCASSSARASQTATLEQISANRYAGEFTNSEYNVTGSIAVTQNGNSVSAILKGGGASAFFNLSR